MAYTTINKPSNYFDTKLYTGTGSAQSITGLGFSPDFVWIKDRTSANNHRVLDTVRGATKELYPNLNSDAETTQAQSLTAFNSDGFSIGTLSTINTNANNYVSWNWDANGSGSSNNSGTITSTVSANTTSGFSIVTYTGNSSSSATVGHGLGVSPSMIILHGRAGTNAANNWFIYHKNLSANNNLIFTTAAQAGTGTFSSGVVSSPTSSTFGFTAGSSVLNVNESGTTYVAYCFADVKGFSKFGSYTGNGSSDGTFVYTGFKPAFVMFKITNTTGNWYLNDTTRRSINVNSYTLFPNLSDAETTTGAYIDMLSNGFKLRDTGSVINGSGNTFIYMAFAEQPLVGTNNVPATAR